MPLARFAGFFGFSGVALGAIGAHLLKTRLLAAGTTELWHTAALYHLLHAACLLALCFAPVPMASTLRVAYRFFILGILFFSGSLYCMALGAPRWFGFITPLGGTCVLIGWAAVFLWGFRRPEVKA